MKCRICENETRLFLDLGPQPIANNFREIKTEFVYSLELSFCPVCCTVQLEDTVPRSSMFNDSYPFFTSSSVYMQRHFRRLADLIKDEYLLPDGFIVEIGSNDGTFLRNFKEYKHLGVEPSANVACASNDLNVNIDFFNKEFGRDIFKADGYANVIVSTNVFPHMENRDSVLKGIKWLLDPCGVWINEEAYLGSIIANTSYDQFYNEHIYTSSVASFRNTMNRYGLELINCEYQSVHGGSMRYYVTHQSNAIKKLSHLKNILYVVCQENLIDYIKLQNFASDVKISRIKFLERIEKADGPIVGYGATAKSATILNYCQLDSSVIEKVYDTIPEKQGKYIPGTDIPVVPYSDFDVDKPKNAVLFAWNHMEEIFEKEKGKDINWILPI